MLLKSQSEATHIAIEVTPLIDMVFLLLIFFLVATTFQQEEREMQIALPFANSSAPISAMLKELIVNVDGDGEFIVNGRNVEADRLRAMVEQAVAVNPEQKVIVRGDRSTAFAHIVTVLDICKGAGIQEPYLDTVLTDGAP